VVKYRADAGTCEACSLKAKCTPSKKGREVLRYFDESYVDRVKTYRGTFPYEKALRKRRVWDEPLFAEAKDWHGLRRFRLRRLEKVNAEALLIAAGQNVKRLVALRIPARTTRRTSDHITSHGRLSCHRQGRFSTGWQA